MNLKTFAILVLAVWCAAATYLLTCPRAVPPAHAMIAAPVVPAPVETRAPAGKDLLALQDEVAKLRADNTRLMKELADARAGDTLRTLTHRASTNATARFTVGDATNMAQEIAAQVQKALAQSLAGGAGGLFGRSPEAVAKRYASLLDRLGLSAAQRQEAVDALARAPQIMRLASGKDVPPENEDLKKLLTPDQYAQWQKYEQALPYSDAVSDFEQRLASKGASLSAAQRASLLDIFQRNDLARANQIQLALEGNGQKSDSTHALDDNYNRWDKVVDESRAVLTSAQQQELDGYLGERASAHERLAEMVNVRTLGDFGPGGGVSGSVRVISMEMDSVISTGAVPAIRINAGGDSI